MPTLHTRQKTHQAVLPQRPALESVSADNPGVGTKRGTEAGLVPASGVQHDRGESQTPVASGPGRHTDPAPAGEGTESGCRREQSFAPIQNRVFVLDRRGRPLQPTTPARARRLLKAGRARVVKVTPFVIRIVDRLVEDSEVDGVQVKVDPGSVATGVAVTTVGDHPEGLVLVEVQHRSKQISGKLKSRAALRRGRRSRNLRYRAPRFDNRTKPEGWLAPSLRHRVETTAAWVERIRRWAPVTGVSMELVRFDTQVLENPEISGVEYQQGTLAGFEAREYLLAKWRHRCCYCDTTGVPLNLDHIRPRSKGASDRVSNLCLACIPCNQAKSNRPIEEFLAGDPARLARITRQAKAPLRDAAAVNSTRWALHRALTATGLPVEAGTGGRTKWNRTRFDVPKAHVLDALCVGTIEGTGQWPAVTLVAASTGRGRYRRSNVDQYGFPSGKACRVKQVHGFQTGDHVRAVVPTGKKTGIHTGRVAVRATGSFNIRTSAGLVKDVNHKYCRLIQRGDGWGYTTQPTPSRALKEHHDEA